MNLLIPNGGRMRRRLIILALLISLFFPRPVQAQSNITIQTLDVEIWPEYDKPSVLVIYRITLSPQVKLPAEMVLRVPRTGGTVSAVAEQTANGLFNISYTDAGTDGDWQMYKFTTTLPQLQLEYYDANLSKNGSTRSYSYRWPGDYPVQTLTVKVQQPRTASNMTLQPSTGTSAQAADGLTYFNVPVGNVDAGGTFKLDLKYEKSDDLLTQPQTFEAVTPAAPVNQATPGRVTFNEVIPWALGGLGLLLIAIGVVWYVRTGRQPASAGEKRHKRAIEVAPPGRVEKNGTAGATFCHQCGKRAGEGDVFCRACGAKLRR
jgi:hypothetical protein